MHFEFSRQLVSVPPALLGRRPLPAALVVAGAALLAAVVVARLPPGLGPHLKEIIENKGFITSITTSIQGDQTACA